LIEDAMSTSIPNLWPEEFKFDVQTPYTILRVQANLLSKVTRGVLVGDVETEASEERVQHRLVVIAPAYNGYRHTLVVALHNPDLPYPAEVRAEALAEKDNESPFLPPLSPLDNPVYPRAYSDDEMQALVQRALQSEQTRAVIHSLIAQSYEGKLSPSSLTQGGTDNGDREGQESLPPDSGTDSELKG
jgi:hypothetical protein